MKKLIFTLSIFFLPIAGHGIMAILGNEEARFFLHWSMLLATLIGSGLGILIVKGIAELRTEHDICVDLLLFAIVMFAPRFQALLRISPHLYLSCHHKTQTLSYVCRI